MKCLMVFALFSCLFIVSLSNLKAEISRSPAVVEEPFVDDGCENKSDCQLGIPTTKVKEIRVQTGRAPAIEQDSSFDGKRIPKLAPRDVEVVPPKEIVDTTDK